MNGVQNETLSIYKVDFFDYGPEIMLSVMIQRIFPGWYHIKSSMSIENHVVF